MKSELRSLMLRLRSHSFSFFSYGLKAKARAKDFLHKAFHYLHLKIDLNPNAFACRHIAFHLLHAEFDFAARKQMNSN